MFYCLGYTEISSLNIWRDFLRKILNYRIQCEFYIKFICVDRLSSVVPGRIWQAKRKNLFHIKINYISHNPLFCVFFYDDLLQHGDAPNIFFFLYSLGNLSKLFYYYYYFNYQTYGGTIFLSIQAFK
jgi:hypothetical protein